VKDSNNKTRQPHMSFAWSVGKNIGFKITDECYTLEADFFPSGVQGLGYIKEYKFSSPEIESVMWWSRKDHYQPLGELVLELGEVYKALCTSQGETIGAIYSVLGEPNSDSRNFVGE